MAAAVARHHVFLKAIIGWNQPDEANTAILRRVVA
jgi:hypothetical protein